MTRLEKEHSEKIRHQQKSQRTSLHLGSSWWSLERLHHQNLFITGYLMGRFLRSWCLQKRLSYKQAEELRNYISVCLTSVLVKFAEITKNRVSVHVDKYKILRKTQRLLKEKSQFINLFTRPQTCQRTGLQLNTPFKIKMWLRNNRMQIQQQQMTSPLPTYSLSFLYCHNLESTC